MNEPSDPDEVWQRPAAPQTGGAEEPAVEQAPETTAYAGPPAMTSPSFGPVGVVRLPPVPPTLPEQDHTALDAAEERAQQVTGVVALVGGSLGGVLLIVMLIQAMVR